MVFTNLQSVWACSAAKSALPKIAVVAKLLKIWNFYKRSDSLNFSKSVTLPKVESSEPLALDKLIYCFFFYLGNFPSFESSHTEIKLDFAPVSIRMDKMVACLLFRIRVFMYMGLLLS